MRYLIGFDDTDTVGADRGTGKLVRWLEDVLPAGCRLYGVVRQQLLVAPGVPYTSHNSAACALVDGAGGLRERLVRIAARHIESYALEGSDPGLCLAAEGDSALEALADHGRRCTREIVTREEASLAAEGVHLSGHGGTDDGVIGAAAAVGLTWLGWSGRFIERGALRDLPDPLTVGDLREAGIAVVSVERDALFPGDEESVTAGGWLRPRLWGGRAVLPVEPVEDGMWRALGRKNRHGTTPEAAAAVHGEHW